MSKVEDILKMVEELSVLELSELVKQCVATVKKML